ncbi:phosphoglycerate kinase [uncultured Tateyamaria sp.]|uniref:phosphoglycerate kinase n=1 Tax=uncultured Tateyamaria sp. TaxID=455651 RepID=UPI002637EC7A|nr:phosphoglycerate kinase [uncultured Tateyamaria sp.]
MGWKSLDDMDLSGKRVLTRVDINVPMEDGRITDATRIERIVPTITDIRAKGGSPVLLAHFGRPKGQPNPAMSLQHLVPALEDAFNASVTFVERPSRDWIDQQAGDAIILVENTRFNPMEEANDPQMAQFLATLGDVYCNDAFSAAHRAHASTTGVAHLLPACAGRLMQAELEALEAALSNPRRPVGAVVGGAKVSTKLDLLQNLVKKIDVLIIGGGMANTFIAAQGADLGASLQEADLHDTARDIIAAAKEAGCKVILPSDGRVATEFKAGADHEVIALGSDTKLNSDQMVLDAGDDAAHTIARAFDDLETLIWNGPLGAFEIPPFDTATVAAAKAAAQLTRAGTLVTVAGGGDTVAALNQAGVADDFTYISTGGGAFLEWMEGKELPGVAALTS